MNPVHDRTSWRPRGPCIFYPAVSSVGHNQVKKPRGSGRPVAVAAGGHLIFPLPCGLPANDQTFPSGDHLR